MNVPKSFPHRLASCDRPGPLPPSLVSVSLLPTGWAVSVAVLVAVWAAAVIPANRAGAAPPPVPVPGTSDEVTIQGFGITLRPPPGWVRVGPDRTPTNALARFVGPADNRDGRVLDLTVAPAPEAATPATVRDRSVQYYRANLPGVEISAVRDATTAGRPGFEIALTYTDEQKRPSTFVERAIVIGGRVYSLRMAALGQQTTDLAVLLGRVADGLKLDAKITDLPDPANFTALANRLKGLDARRLVPLEQYLLLESAAPGASPVGYLYLRFERAKFQGREGLFLRVRSLTELPDGARLREKAWSFATDDWSYEQWAATTQRETSDAKSELLLEENGRREGSNVELRYRTASTTAAEQTETFTVGADYLPIAAEPALAVLAAREARGEFAYSYHIPGQRLVSFILTANPPEEFGPNRVRVAVLGRRPVGQTEGQTQYVDGEGRTLLVRVGEGATIRGVDKAALLRAYPGATDLSN